jgi:predicted DNA-binding protein (MmcQ/YjbR family)
MPPDLEAAMTVNAPLRSANAKTLRTAALQYPATTEEFPWNHHAYKAAGKKVFLYLTGLADGGFNCSMKLPFRNEDALRLRGAEPTGYGMGASGWVTFTYAAKAKPPMAKLLDYLDESWRAVAPKKLSAAHRPPSAASKRRKGP